MLRLDEQIYDSSHVYVSYGLGLRQALQWTIDRRGVRNPVVVDTHSYYTFSDKERSQTPRDR